MTTAANGAQLEALLRPPIEYLSAASYGLAAGMLLTAPDYLMMTPSAAAISSIGLGGMAVKRYLQGKRVRTYQRGLRKLPVSVMSFANLPVYQSRLYIGEGFAWKQRHVQRAYDCSQSNAEKYIQPNWLFRKARLIELKAERYKTLEFFAKFTRSQSWWNPIRPYPEVGGNPWVHGVGLQEEGPVYINSYERVGHTVVFGTTRVGKTRLAEMLIAQDIRRGDVVIVFDPKGDAELFKRMYTEAKRAGRLDQFYFFHLGYPEISARYNPIGSFHRVTEVASRIAGQLPGEGQSATFREFVWKFVNTIAKALNALSRRIDIDHIKYYAERLEPLVIDYLEFVFRRDLPNQAWQQTCKDIAGFFNDPDNKEYRKPRHLLDRDSYAYALCHYFQKSELRDPVAESLISTYEYDKAYWDKLVASLMPLLEKLSTGKCAELISPDYDDLKDTRPIFDWASIIRTGGIVYVGLDALSDPEVAAAVGNSMFADLTSWSGGNYKFGTDQGLPPLRDPNNNNKVVQLKRRICVHADEFNELIGDEFIPLLNKAGGSGVAVTAYTQTWPDVEAKIGNKAKALQIAGNFNTLIMLRVKHIGTAEFLTGHLPEVEVKIESLASGYTDVADPSANTQFISNTQQGTNSKTAPLIHTNHVMTLPKGQAFALLDGGKPYKIRIPMPDEKDLAELPQDLTRIAQQMKARYQSTEDWYHFTPSWKAQSTWGEAA